MRTKEPDAFFSDIGQFQQTDHLKSRVALVSDKLLSMRVGRHTLRCQSGCCVSILEAYALRQPFLAPLVLASDPDDMYC